MSVTIFCLFYILLQPVAGIRFELAASGAAGMVIAEVNGTEGGVCPDNITFRETTVICREMGRGWGKEFISIPFNSSIIPTQRHVVRISTCYGNETDIGKCTLSSIASGVPCTSRRTLAVTCSDKLPDIKADEYLVETTNYIIGLPIYTLECAAEENCLAPSARAMFNSQDPSDRYYNQRFLLRFTSVIKNIGTAPFLPLLQKHQWRYHACHQHYHSMPDFARYLIMDKRRNKMALGHKSSFCLEDSECDSGVKEHFRCSHVAYNYGDQGISPGCLDAYFHDYDCQWIDITDLKYGNYIFQMVINPGYLVAESDYSNNGIECDFHYYQSTGVLRRCFVKHPLELNV